MRIGNGGSGRQGHDSNLPGAALLVAMLLIAGSMGATMSSPAAAGEQPDDVVTREANVLW